MRRCKQRWAVSCIYSHHGHTQNSCKAARDMAEISMAEIAADQKMRMKNQKCQTRQNISRTDRTNKQNGSKVGIQTEPLGPEAYISMSQMLSALSIPPALCREQFHHQQTGVGTAATSGCGSLASSASAQKRSRP